MNARCASFFESFFSNFLSRECFYFCGNKRRILVIENKYLIYSFMLKSPTKIWLETKSETERERSPNRAPHAQAGAIRKDSGWISANVRAWGRVWVRMQATSVACCLGQLCRFPLNFRFSFSSDNSWLITHQPTDGPSKMMTLARYWCEWRQARASSL